MMKRFFSLTTALFFLCLPLLKADEGMWILTLLNKNYDDMKAQGFKLTPEDIYNLNKPSIKDAIVIFGGGCTGEIISDKGLLLTNHHCGYDAIQSHSTIEHNYLQDGFWAASMADELPNQDVNATFLVRIEDVTASVTKDVTDKMTETERNEAIRKAGDELSKKATEGTHYTARVQPFFEGNYYYMMVYETYKDVRLVGTPPSSIGKFGYDTDNWMWPRHTGDFSMFRVYSGPDGKPAEYSADNIPLSPKYHLPISLKGVQKGDFSMIMGYPGSTDRYLTSYGIEELVNVTNANRAHIRGIRQDILQEDMRADETINIMYASKFSRSSNYWKYSIGQNRGLKRLNVMAKKQKTEQEFTTWVNADKNRKKKYAEALPLLEKAYKQRKDFVNANQYVSECLLRGVEVLGFATRFSRTFDKDPAAAKVYADDFFKDYSAATDRKVAKTMIKLFFDEVDAKFHPAMYASIQADFGGDINAFVDNMFDKSMFADKAKLDAFLANPDKAVLEADPAYKASTAVYAKYSELWTQSEAFNSDVDKGRRLFLAGLMEMNPNRTWYPNANFSMRLTYGSVGDYQPADAVRYDYFTTLKGVMEKDDPDNWEFYVDPKLKDLYNAKDFGQYANSDGTMWVCFTTNNDITGGNSGSPVMNGNGELIGCAFDGNWEAMSGDVAFETELQKTICVDIRYVLFIVDKFAGAKHLVDEMTIVK